jgi:hypothetical protein
VTLCPVWGSKEIGSSRTSKDKKQSRRYNAHDTLLERDCNWIRRRNLLRRYILTRKVEAAATALSPYTRPEEAILTGRGVVRLHREMIAALLKSPKIEFQLDKIRCCVKYGSKNRKRVERLGT